MKRQLGIVAAFVVAATLGATATAAPVTFDVTGGYSWSRSGDANAGNPAFNGGLCPPGISEGLVNTCFRWGFAAGSSVTVDITGNFVTMLGGNLDIIDAAAVVQFGTIVLTTTTHTTIIGGVTGTLYGDSILWDYSNSSCAPYTTTGTITCTGTNCGLISFPVGVPLPIDPYLYLVTNSTPTSAMLLSWWELDPTHTQILASTNAITRWSNVVELGNRRQGFVTFGPTSLGNPAPEPASAVLVLLALGALAVRAKTRRA